MINEVISKFLKDHKQTCSYLMYNDPKTKAIIAEKREKMELPTFEFKKVSKNTATVKK